MKREIRQGPKLAVTGVKEGTTRRLAPIGSRKPAPGANYSGQGNPSAASGFGKRISEGAKFERLRASRAALATKSSGGTQNKPTTTLPKPTNTKAADYAALQQGRAKDKSAVPKPNLRPNPVAPAASVKKVGRLSRTEREGLSTDRMQRKPKGNLLGFLKKRK
jgi:hypothetical protein